MVKYSNKSVNSKCPLCFSHNSKLLYTIDSYNVTKYLIPENSNNFKKMKKVIEGLWKGKSCKKLMCKDCKLTYVDPFVGGDQEFYSLIYNSNSKYPDSRKSYDLTIKSIQQIDYQNQSPTLMEIGGGKGAFLDMIKGSLIKRENLFSNEINPVGVKAIESKGIKNYLNLYSNIKQRFDVICAFDVLEHAGNLDRFLNRISELLKDNGHLYFSTPETSQIFFYEMNNASLDLPPNHISCWNRKSFDKLCEKYGFEYVEDDYDTGSFFRRIVNFGLGRFESGKLIPNSIEEQINLIKSKKRRKFFIFFYLFYNSPYTLIKVLFSKIVLEQWVHLKKISPEKRKSKLAKKDK